MVASREPDQDQVPWCLFLCTIVEVSRSRRQSVLEEASILTNIKDSPLPVLACYWDLEALSVLCWTPEGGMNSQLFRYLLGNLECKAWFWPVGPGMLPGNDRNCAVLRAGILYYLVCSSSSVWQSVLTSGHLFAVEHVYFLCVFMCVLLAVQHVNLREGDFPAAHWLINLYLYI